MKSPFAADFREHTEYNTARKCAEPCTTIRHIIRAPRRIVAQIGNLRRIVNPPPSLGRDLHPSLRLAAMRGRLAICAPVVYRRNWRVPNPPQATSLPPDPRGEHHT